MPGTQKTTLPPEPRTGAFLITTEKSLGLAPYACGAMTAFPSALTLNVMPLNSDPLGRSEL